MEQRANESKIQCSWDKEAVGQHFGSLNLVLLVAGLLVTTFIGTVGIVQSNSSNRFRSSPNENQNGIVSETSTSSIDVYDKAMLFQRIKSDVKKFGWNSIYHLGRNRSSLLSSPPQPLVTNRDSGSRFYICKNHSYTNGTWEQDESSVYSWKAYQDSTSNPCKLAKWNPKRFCKVLNKRSVLIVGDSINGDIYRAMMHAFGQKGTTEQYQRIENHTTAVHRTAAICDGRSEITYIRNDWITPSGFQEMNVTSKQLLVPWKHFLKYYDILILNSGTHQRPLKDYRENLEHLDAFLSTSYNGTVIFRTTPRGHMNCSNNDIKPIARYNDRDWNRFFGPQLPKQYPYYGWKRFSHYNELMISILSYKYTVIDIAPILELRPDVHKPPNSCLEIHESKESVLDVWHQLLLNALEGRL